MTARSPNAFALSAALHGAVVLGIFVWAWAAQHAVQETPHIFEVVAGGGDNASALVAPAQGDPNAAKFSLPQPASPNRAVVLTHVPETAQTHEPANALVQTKTSIPIKTQAKTTVKPQSSANQTSTQKPTATATSPVKVQHINGLGIANGVVGGSTANTRGGAGGTALEREQASALDTYLSMMVQRLREAHVKPDGLSDLLEARVEFRLNADGSVAFKRIATSSGNAAFDQSVLDAFRAMRPLGSTPNHQPIQNTVLFKMRDSL